MEIYLTVEGIKGQSGADQAKDHMKLLAYGHGLTHPISRGPDSGKSSEIGRPNFQDITVTKHVDMASPLMFGACAAGQPIKKAQIDAYSNDKEGGKPLLYYTIALEDVIITSASHSGGHDLGVETFTLNFRKVTWTYNVQKPKAPGGAAGKVVSGWDLEANKKA